MKNKMILTGLILILFIFPNISYATNLTVSILTPTDNNISTTDDIYFYFEANDSVSSILNASLWTNLSGTWAFNNTNHTGEVDNNTEEYIALDDIEDGNYIWNINVSDVEGNWQFASSNFTLTIDTTPTYSPTIIFGLQGKPPTFLSGGAGTLVHSLLSNLLWSLSGHTMDTDLDMNSNSITEIDDANMTRLDVSGDASIGGTFFVDSVNNRVGIGTATPGAALHIATNVGAGIKLERGTLDTRWWGASGGPAYFGTISNDALNFRTNNNNRMTIASGVTGGAVDVVGDFTAGTIQADDGYDGYCVNTTYVGGIATACND